MNRFLEKYEAWLLARVEGKPLSIFRILFGLFVTIDAWYFQTFLPFYWPSQKYFFHFPLFEWWPHFDHEVNTYLLVSGALAGICLAIGFGVRFAAFWISLVVSHLLLTEATVYLNHLVLVLMISIILIFIPSDRYFSFRKSRVTSPDKTIARYELFSVVLLFWMSYAYSAIEKMRVEWLNGDIIAANMGIKRESNSLAAWLYASNFLQVQAWVVLCVELFVPFLLLYRKTRFVTVVFLILFHLINLFTLDIGLFSFLMFASLILYWKMDEVLPVKKVKKH